MVGVAPSAAANRAPVFRNRTAWRALIDADTVAEEFRTPEVQLWLGHDAHLVHYPVKGGKLINIVAIVNDRWSEPGWNAEGKGEELLAHYSPWRWSEPVREFLGVPDRWLKWALYDLPPFAPWGEGPVTLLGDAAHPMLPFLAQGAAMAIEDAAVLAGHMAQTPDDPAHAMRRYERERRRRTAQVQNAARGNGRIYHLAAGEALVRNLVLRLAAERCCCAATIGSMIGKRRRPAAMPGRARCLAPRRPKNSSRIEPHVPHHHRRQPAETVVARRA